MPMEPLHGRTIVLQQRIFYIIINNLQLTNTSVSCYLGPPAKATAG